jgi:acyl-CoA synthetase (AMP-forming)/AMP-acid ligase II
MLIHDFLNNSADEFPDKKCILHDDKEFTYKEIRSMSNRIANALHSLGVKKGERVGILLRNSVEYIASYYGCLMAGAITVPINTDITSEELKMLVFMSGIKVLFTEKKYYKHIKNINEIRIFIFKEKIDQGDVMGATVDFKQLLSEKAEIVADKKIHLNDIASIIFTSGSTGRPKGVTLSHRNIAENTKSIIQYLTLCSEDRIMVILPFYYVYGKSLLNTHFAVGGSLIIENSFIYPNIVLEKMHKGSATGFAGVPSTFTILLNRSSIGKYAFPSLRYITQAGGPMPPSVIKRVAEVFPGKDIFIMYGATEASARLTYLHPSKLWEKLGSIGKAIPGVRIEIKREDESVANNGEIGEIVAYGENIMQGYWTDFAATSNVLKGGGYHTGDLAYRDEDGYIFLVGRKDDVIKIAGHKVSTREVEDLIYEIREVHEAAVVGVDDEILGTRIDVFVVKINGASLTEKEILDYCRQRIPLYMVPSAVKFLDYIPKNESGKYVKNRLITK